MHSTWVVNSTTCVPAMVFRACSLEAGEDPSVLGLKGMFAAFVTAFEQHPGLFSRRIQRMKAAPGALLQLLYHRTGNALTLCSAKKKASVSLLI